MTVRWWLLSKPRSGPSSIGMTMEVEFPPCMRDSSRIDIHAIATTILSSASWRVVRNLTPTRELVTSPPAGNIFVVNPGEIHTGEAASENGYVYRTLCLSVNFVARAIAFLADPQESGYINGHALVADGGWIADGRWEALRLRHR